MDAKNQLLDIAMNLNRVGNWAADDFMGKQKRISLFLSQTEGYIKQLKTNQFPPKLMRMYSRFLPEFQKLVLENKVGPTDPLYWAERAMTWGNILTHRAQLLSS